jgi:cytochrome c oxidase subunit III
MIAVTHGEKIGFRPPHRASVIGLWLVLAALGMLFVSSMLLYVLMRLHVFGRISNEPIHMPLLAWGSTIVLLAGSFTAHRAVAAIRRERLGTCLKFLYITSALAVLFLIVQSPCMAQVLDEHRQLRDAAAANKVPGQFAPVSLYGLVFILILLHALHVVGGIIALGIVTWRARGQKYDHENYLGVQFAARYWHFLDIVWIAMFTMFLVMG